jgi:hypothetical protein
MATAIIVCATPATAAGHTVIGRTVAAIAAAIDPERVRGNFSVTMALTTGPLRKRAMSFSPSLCVVQQCTRPGPQIRRRPYGNPGTDEFCVSSWTISFIEESTRLR